MIVRKLCPELLLQEKNPNQTTRLGWGSLPFQFLDNNWATIQFLVVDLEAQVLSSRIACPGNQEDVVDEHLSAARVDESYVFEPQHCV